MAIPLTRSRAAIGRIQWRRGARAAIAIASIMVVCELLHRPMGWAALGVLQVFTVDNGGPYRSRLGNIATALVGGGVAIVFATLASGSLSVAIGITALFCFAATLARVISQPLASASVSILVCYIVAYGGQAATFSASAASALYYCIGGLWAASFSLLLWPVDPFQPARNAVADLYARLTELAAALPAIDATADRTALNEFVPQIRLLIETAENTLAATPARMTARTVRARNLAAIVQAADLLFARILRVAELGVHHQLPEAHTARTSFTDLSAWLAASLRPVEAALRQRPADDGAAFSAEGSLTADMHRHALSFEAAMRANDPGSRSGAISTQLDTQFAAVERDCLLSFEVVYEAVRAIWTGAEPRASRAAALRSSFAAPAAALPSTPQIWLDAVLANLTTRSIMFRHALRLAAVAAVDVLLLRVIHITHGYWLAMTSVIVLQPYTGETWRRSGDRVGGTVAGAILAALLAAAIPSETGIIAVISIGCFFTLAVYAVDYAWYSFFLTPTIVLLTLPQLRDWHFAAVRVGMTGLGALTALLAMLLFWPQRETAQLPRLLARAAAADAAYIRAMLTFWQCPTGNLQARTLAERNVLAPARRACGLATNHAEESLDRSLLEHSIPLRATPAHERLNHDALNFTTYLRRLTQGITTLAVVGADSPQLAATADTLATRLDAVSTKLLAPHPEVQPPSEIALDSPVDTSLAARQLARMQRQVGILERTAADISTAATPA